MTTATFNSRAIETLAIRSLNLLPTGTAASGSLESRDLDSTLVTFERAEYNLTCGVTGDRIETGRGAQFADGLATVGSGRNTKAVDISIKCLNGPMSFASVDAGCNKAGQAIIKRAQDGQVLIVAVVAGKAGEFPAGKVGTVVGTECHSVQFHRIDSALAGEVAYYLTPASERAMHRVPEGAAFITSTDDCNAWWRAQDGYWRVRVRLDGSTAISPEMSMEEGAKFAEALADEYGQVAAQRNGASHKFDTLRFWKQDGTVKVKGASEGVTLPSRLASILETLMDGEFHSVAEMTAAHKGLRVNMGTLNKTLIPMGFEVTNTRKNKGNADTGKHGYRLRAA